MDKNKTLTEAANDLIEHAMERGIPARMIPFMEALRVANNERKAESEAARLEIESLKAKNLELERLCDATYVTQGADAYNHACSMMEQYQAEREAARKEVGTEGSLCDGISWLYTRIASLESQHEGGKSEALADLAYAHGVGGHARCLLEAASVRLAAVAKPAAPDITDAYAGAQEGIAIWKKRALEAEALNHRFITDINGPTFVGEPTTSDDAFIAREFYESQDDSLLLCASDLQHSAIYDNHIEMQSCIRAVADRITALASVIEGVERAHPAKAGSTFQGK